MDMEPFEVPVDWSGTDLGEDVDAPGWDAVGSQPPAAAGLSWSKDWLQLGQTEEKYICENVCGAGVSPGGLWQPGRGGMSTGLGAVPMAVGWGNTAVSEKGKNWDQHQALWLGGCVSSASGSLLPPWGVSCLWQLLGFVHRSGMCWELWGAITTSPLPGRCSALELPHTSREQLCDSPRLQLPINFLESSFISLNMPPWPSSASFPAEVFPCGSCLSSLTSSCPSVFQVSPFLSPLSSCSFLLSLALGASLSPLNSRNVCAGMNLLPFSLPS